MFYDTLKCTLFPCSHTLLRVSIAFGLGLGSLQFLEKLTKPLLISLTTLLIRVTINYAVLLFVIQPSYTPQ